VTGSKTLGEYAVDYAQRGWPVLPRNPGSKAPYIDGGVHSASTNLNVIADWWQRFPHAMIGVRMGGASGVWALDPDPPKKPGAADGLANWRDLLAKNGGCPATHTHHTPRGGLHLLFKWRGDRPITNSEGRLKGLGINVRGNGGYVIAPPSQRADGKEYEIAEPLDFFHFADAPEWLYELILAKPAPSISERALALVKSPSVISRDTSAYVEAAVRNEYDAVASTVVGGRNNQLNASSFSLGTLVGAGELSRDEAEHALYQAAIANGYIADKGGRQTKATIGSGLEAGIKHPRKIPEREVAPRLATEHGQTIPEAPAPNPIASDPVDLWAKFDPPTLPRRVLPDVIERFAFDQGSDMGADMAGIAVSALAVCAAAIPDRIQLQVKRHNSGWLESARLWVALVGPPSSMKSPIMAAAVRPLRRIDSEMARQYAEARARYDKLPKEEKLQAPPPKQIRLLLQDTTIEAAQEVLKDSPDGVLCYQDEMSGWFGSMDKYSGARGAAKDRAFWLEAFNGSPYSVNRVGRGAGFIENLSVSLVGGIQPEPVRKLADESMDDGLLQRLVPIVNRSAVEGRDEEMSPVVSEYSSVIGRLHNLGSPVLGGGPALLRFDEGAQRYRQELERKHLDLQSCESIHRKLAAHIGKYNGIFARLCVVWHCVESAPGNLPAVISEETARRVGAFLHGFLLPHALSFYAGVLGLSNEHDRLAAVAGYILAHKLECITNRDVQRGDRTMRGLERHQIEAIFDQLDALGWIDRIPGPRPTSPSRWVVNPTVHTKFTERAKAEADRRTQERKVIADLLRASG
jgi:hypothetical protein